MQARGGKLHLESLALGAVQATKRRSPAPREPGWPKNANQTHPTALLLHIRYGVVQHRSPNSYSTEMHSNMHVNCHDRDQAGIGYNFLQLIYILTL
jgi:hypothetical protein